MTTIAITYETGTENLVDAIVEIASIDAEQGELCRLQSAYWAAEDAAMGAEATPAQLEACRVAEAVFRAKLRDLGIPTWAD